MKVLSLFDGISCGMVALERAGIPVEKYVAYEIDEKAMKVSKHNYPAIEHKGNVFNAKHTEGEFDLLIGGSPCQDLSIVGSKKGLSGEKSSLFFEFVRALKQVKPKYFLFENVSSMKNCDREIISDLLGVEPIKIDSQLFSAQKRNRLYWTNIPVKIPTERTVSKTLQDELEAKVDDKYYLSEKMFDCVMSAGTNGWISGKREIDLRIARPLTSTMHKMHRADSDNYVSTDYCPEGKTNVRRLTPVECERLQTLPDGYTEGLSDTQRYICIGNAWTVDVIAHIFKGLQEGD